MNVIYDNVFSYIFCIGLFSYLENCLASHLKTSDIYTGLSSSDQTYSQYHLSHFTADVSQTEHFMGFVQDWICHSVWLKHITNNSESSCYQSCVCRVFFFATGRFTRQCMLCMYVSYTDT